VDTTTACPHEEGGLRVGALRLLAAQSSCPIERGAHNNPRPAPRADAEVSDVPLSASSLSLREFLALRTETAPPRTRRLKVLIR
jgi:hypothetical protein